MFICGVCLQLLHVVDCVELMTLSVLCGEVSVAVEPDVVYRRC